MSSLIPFVFEKHNIRVVVGDDGEPLFVGKDVCDALGYANHSKAMGDHCKGVTKRYPILDSMNRPQETRVLTEPDVLRLIVNCSLPSADAFERWVFEEVLPSIRKTGSYTAPGARPARELRPVDNATQALKMMPMAVRAARSLGLDQNAAAISANQYVCAVTGQNLLREFGHTHIVAENQDTQWFTPTQLSDQAQLSAVKLNRLLASAGFQARRGDVWELLDAGRPYARLFDTGKKHDSGAPIQQIKWSPAVIDAARNAAPKPALEDVPPRAQGALQLGESEA